MDVAAAPPARGLRLRATHEKGSTVSCLKSSLDEPPTAALLKERTSRLGCGGRGAVVRRWHAPWLLSVLLVGSASYPAVAVEYSSVLVSDQAGGGSVSVLVEFIQIPASGAWVNESWGGARTFDSFHKPCPRARKANCAATRRPGPSFSRRKGQSKYRPRSASASRAARARRCRSLAEHN